MEVDERCRQSKAPRQPSGSATRDQAKAKRPQRSAASRLDQSLVAFAIAAGVPLLLAFRGGSYDVVARQEFGLVLWWGIALLLVFRRLPKARLMRAAQIAVLTLLMVAGWNGLSLLWTESHERTGIELARLVSLAGIVVLPYFGLNRFTWRAAANGLLLAVLVLPFLALAGRLAPDLVPWADTPGFSEGRRLIAPLGYWNALAAWSAMAVGMGLVNSAHRRQPLIRALSLAAVPIAGTVIYLTYSRAGIAGAALALALALLLGRNRVTVGLHGIMALIATTLIVLVVRSQASIEEGLGGEGGAIVAVAVLLAALTCMWIADVTRRAGTDRLRLPARSVRLALASFCVVAAVTLAVVGPSLGSRASNQFFASGHPSEAGDPAARLVTLEGSRDQIWGSALGALAEHPAGGIGPGTFEFWWSRDTDGQALRDAHSLYLETLAEQGLPGFAFLMAFLFAIATAALVSRRLLRRDRDHGLSTGLVVAFFVFLFHAGVDWMWEATAVAVVGLASAAIAGTAGASANRSRRRRLGVRASLAIAASLLAGAVQVPGIVATERLRGSADALASGDVARATDLADDAVNAEPWAATPYAARALAELRGEQFALAKDDIDAAIEREPTNWRLWRWRSGILLSAGEVRGSLAALDRMAELSLRSAEDVPRLKQEVRDRASDPR